MRIALFDTRRYDRESFEGANRTFGHELVFLEPRLTQDTAPLARGCPCVCSFVNDRLDAPTLKTLASEGVRLIALRCAGFNHVDRAAAAALRLPIVRVPAYSPHAVAEHTVALALTLNRKIHRAHARVREANFALDGLVGFDLHGKTVGIIGTGQIGSVAARIFHGFGCRLLAYDPRPNTSLTADLGVRFTDLDELYRESDLVTLHVPLMPSTRHLVDAGALGKMKPGVMILNTGRGALIDTRALVEGLKSGRVGSAGLDVYEEEESLFFEDRSDQVLQDDVLARLLTFPNVLITAHQAFLTREALANIAETTLSNVTAFEKDRALPNLIPVPGETRRMR